MAKSRHGKLTIIWGGQFGSEGKGQIAAYICGQDKIHMGVRVGGPNAGHTFYHGNGRYGSALTQKIVVQSIPVAAMLGAEGIIGAAGLILPDLLIGELKRGYELLGRRPVQLSIDANAVFINPAHMGAEAVSLKERIGSTGEGVGAATADKAMRMPDITAAYNWARFFRPIEHERWAADLHLLDDTASRINWVLSEPGYHVMLEGTQGFGLSLHTGGYYPYCTSRECTPQGLLAETGINIHTAKEVESVMVLRTYPIRVGGNSGPLPGEIDWDELKRRTNGYVDTPEKTTVTKKIRRIADFDWGLVNRAIAQCSPDYIALNFLDYVFPEIAKCETWAEFPPHVHAWLSSFQDTAGVTIKYVSWGPGKTSDIVVLPSMVAHHG